MIALVLARDASNHTAAARQAAPTRAHCGPPRISAKSLNEENNQIAHVRIVPRSGNARSLLSHDGKMSCNESACPLLAISGIFYCRL